MSGFEPQTDVRIAVIPCDEALETTPLIGELALLVVPDGANCRLEVLSVGFRANTLPIDGSNAVTVDIEWFDDSASDAGTDLLATYDLNAATALVYNQIWRGSQILDPGDVLNAEFTTTSPDTASEGAGLIVEYRVVKHS